MVVICRFAVVFFFQNEVEVKSIQLIIIFIIITLNCTGQDTSKAKIKESEFALGTFYTLNESNKLTVNPVISGYLGDYYFENRYGYEADSSASVNVGRKIFKKINHVEVIPLAGLVFGSFKGVSAGIQTSLDYRKWAFTTVVQFSFEYTKFDKNLLLNWAVARYKLSNSFCIGIITMLEKQVNQDKVFDKGITAVILYKKWGLRFYGFNYEKQKRYYWLSVLYDIKVKLISR